MYSSEYNNNLTSSNSEYGSSSLYNKIFAQKLPPTVPMMKYPTIMEQGNPFGYDVLSHDKEQVGYYNVKSAYGSNKEPDYFIARCPDNRYIRPFIKKEIISLDSCVTPQPLISEGYKSSKVLMFISPHCSFCQKALNEYKNYLGNDFSSIFEVLDISLPHIEQKMTNLGGYATPFFYSETHSITVTGYFPIHVLFDKLKINFNKKSDLTSIIESLDIIAYIAKGCHFCDKLKELLKDHKIEYRDYANYKHELKNIKGFPTLYSKTTKKTHVGCPSSLEILVHNLS